MHNKKVCILGASGVGKSSLIHRFLNGSFGEACPPTTGARIVKVVKNVDRDKVQLLLWDIEDDNQTPNGFLNYTKGASAFIYMVDGTRLETLVDAMEFRQETEKKLGSAIPGIMLFNKSDLVKGWEISSSMISDVEHNGIFSILTSCKDGTGVNTAFNLITRVMIGKTSLMTNFPVPASIPDTGVRVQSRT